MSTTDPTFDEAVDLVIEAACRLPLDAFADCPKRWVDQFGGLQASIAILCRRRDLRRATEAKAWRSL